MIDLAVTWLQAHPLEGVAALASLGIAVALAVIPGLALIERHGHPRC